MRIAYICNSIIPSRSANSINVMKMCQAFARQGHEVLLIAPNIKDTEELSNEESLFSYYGVEKCFNIIKLPMLPVKGRKTLYGIAGSLIAKQFKANLVYGRFLYGCYYSILFGLDVIYEIHKPIAGKKDEEKLSKMLAKSNFRHLVVITRVLGRYYQDKYYLKEDKIKTAPDAADYPTKGYHSTFSNSNRLQAGYAGHLYPGKGMEIIAKLARKCPWSDFHVVGGTEEDIIYWKDQLSDLKNLIFHGFVPHKLVEKNLQAFDVLLAPYQEKVSTYGGGSGSDIGRWMSPLKLFEYMAAGKPIICSDLPVLREVINDGVNAILCPPEDIDCWIKALCRLNQDPIYSKKLGDNAYNDFAKNYTWAARAKKILSSIEAENRHK